MTALFYEINEKHGGEKRAVIDRAYRRSASNSIQVVLFCSEIVKQFRSSVSLSLG